MAAPAPSSLSRSGIGYALLAYGAWGWAPVWWKQLEAIPALEILAHRVVWTFAFALLLLAVSGLWREFGRELGVRRVAVVLLCTALIIGGNWSLFIWAVNHDRIVDTSLGYFLTPLLNVALGMLFLRERLRPWQGAAVAIAALGVGRLAWELGSLPWISLALGGSFAVYGLLRKLVPVPSLVGLAAETGFLTPLALVHLLSLQSSGAGLAAQSDALSVETIALLVGSGVITAAPLIWFASAARRLPLTSVGLFQYIAPSVSLVIAVWHYGEPFVRAQMESFALIWCALLVYSWDSIRKRSPRR